MLGRCCGAGISMGISTAWLEGSVSWGAGKELGALRQGLGCQRWLGHGLLSEQERFAPCLQPGPTLWGISLGYVPACPVHPQEQVKPRRDSRVGDAGCAGQAACSLPPSGRDWLKTPSTVSQELPSPPHTRHLSSFESEPRTRSQPTCWRKEQQGISRPGGALSSPHLTCSIPGSRELPWVPPHSPPLHYTPGSAQ